MALLLNGLITFLAALSVSSFSLSSSSSSSSSSFSSSLSSHSSPTFMIPNVPYHRQINDYTCGDGSMEMILHYFGPDVDQRAIADVMCTSDHMGTLSYYLVRAAHF